MRKIFIAIIFIGLLASQQSITIAKTFSDIESTNPYFIAVTYLSEKGIIDGYADGSFKPFDNINRAELLKILIEGAEIEIQQPATNCFSDVPYTEWYASYICTAKSSGYINGYADGTFKPSQKVNKVEAIKMLGEIYEWPLEEASQTELFTDTPSNEWYAPYLKYAKMKNLLPESGGKYNPANSITRGSISESLYRLIAITELGEDKFSSSVADAIKNLINTESEISAADIPAADEETTTPSTIITGIITDALKGYELENSTIALYTAEGNFIANTTSNAEGNFELSYTATGEENYLLFSKDGYFSLQIPLTEIIDNDIHVSLSRTFTQISPEELRIVLTWGDSDVDLDAHLLTPNGEEIFFMYRINPDVDAILDVDSTEKYGTETITIKKLQTGTYEYFIHNYSGKKEFSSNGARIEIYDKNGLAKIYYPSDAAGNIWRVFLLNEKGEITDINEIGNCELIEKHTSICPIKSSSP